MLKYYDFSGVSFLVTKDSSAKTPPKTPARFDLVHNPTVPYLTDSKFTPFSAPSRGRLYIRVFFYLQLEGTFFPYLQRQLEVKFFKFLPLEVIS